jgi:hypothetical protein
MSREIVVRSVTRIVGDGVQVAFWGSDVYIARDTTATSQNAIK